MFCDRFLVCICIVSDIIHYTHPCFVAGLKFLVRICSDLGLKEAQEYATKLKKAEKAKELKDQRASSASRRGSGRRREGSAEGGRQWRCIWQLLHNGHVLVFSQVIW